MNISIDQLFEHAYVISIDDKRLSMFYNVFEQNNLPKPKYWKGVKLANNRPDPYFGVADVDFSQPAMKFLQCLMSHLSLIRMAKELDWPFICIFEDDAYPCIDIKQKLEFYLSKVPDDCNCLALGNYSIQCVDYNEDFLKITTWFQGAHAYVLFKDGYDEYIKNYEDWTFVHDRILEKISNLYSPKYNLFIQYNYKPSTTVDRCGYLWEGRSIEQIMAEFPPIEKYRFE